MHNTENKNQKIIIATIIVMSLIILGVLFIQNNGTKKTTQGSKAAPVPTGTYISE